MNIHEYQAKELLRGYGVSVLQGFAAWTPDEAAEAAAKLPGPVYVVKSQIHAGGRGAGHFKDDPQGKGGVRLARSAEEVRAAAEAMLGHTLITKQTGPAGRDVRRVYVEAGCDIKRELYLSLLVDRDTSRVVIMASTEGGMEVEEVAEKHPEKILRVAVDPACRHLGVSRAQAGLRAETRRQADRRVRPVRAGDVHGIHRAGLRHRGNQSTRGDRVPATSSHSMRKSASTTTRSTGTANLRPCATRRRKIRRNSRLHGST